MYLIIIQRHVSACSGRGAAAGTHFNLSQCAYLERGPEEAAGGAGSSSGAGLSERGSRHTLAQPRCPIPGPPAAPLRQGTRSERSAGIPRSAGPCLCLAGPCDGGSPVASPVPACGHVRSRSRAAAIPKAAAVCSKVRGTRRDCRSGAGNEPRLRQRSRVPVLHGAAVLRAALLCVCVWCVQ